MDTKEKDKEVVEVDEETKTDKEPFVTIRKSIVRFVTKTEEEPVFTVMKKIS